ncbi:Glycosyl transferase 4-like domain-containing protein [Nitrosospira sp. Nl5]|uniref:glycosyltransferase n=1 Tax=Nitrosospira sp. Nl5 TaxID=200120 RepID=UPI0008803F0D|nr:glycosyltransferase [Nitrosospira sp. Nl5]SCY15465.1 Glycosyl transferase 4-like domain-containing protein [Nitrosospira sp. Nl5]
MVKRVLMIAFHYPPMRGSSSIQRTLKFSQYLPEFNWKPIVLTAHPRAYSSVSNDQIAEISNQVSVYRAFALDASKHMSAMGRYPGILALPDRWVSWWLGAVPMGLYLIKKYRPDVIWSTYPIATAHLIGFSLCRLTGLPWVADLRDPMTDVDYPPNPRTRRLYEWIEEKTIAHCTRAVLTTPGAIDAYRTKFPKAAPSRFHLIENGYDEENFTVAEAKIMKEQKKNQPFILVHSGVIYPSERDPAQFFEALAALSRQEVISGARLNVILRATAHDEHLRQLIDQYKIGDIVSLAPPISYREALSEMLAADGLLILQASNCNNQIPAKLYKYLRARRPILALTDPTGNTAAALKKMGVDTIAPLDSKNDIMRELVRFLALVEGKTAQIASMEKVLAASRRSRTRELSNLLDRVVQES